MHDEALSKGFVHYNELLERNQKLRAEVAELRRREKGWRWMLQKDNSAVVALEALVAVPAEDDQRTIAEVREAALQLAIASAEADGKETP